MSDFPTFDDLFRTGRNTILSRNAKLKRDVIEREGSDANALVAAMAAVGDEVIGHLIRICAGQSLDSAREQYLRRLVFDRYGISAKGAGSAYGTVEFSTTAPTTVAFDIPKDTKIQTSDGRQFVTMVSASFAEGSTGPVSVAVRSVLAGLSQQAQKNTITNLISTLTNAPDDLAVTNPKATSGAADAEEDTDLKARAKEYFNTVQKGTRAAIKTAALAVPGVYRASIFEAVDALGRSARAAQLVISDAFTDALVSTDSATYAEQSQVLASVVFDELDDVRACGVNVDVIVAQVILISVQLALNFDATIDTDIDTAALRARSAAVSYVNGLSPGETFVPDDLIEQLRYIPGLEVLGNEVISPPGTVIPETLQVLRTTLSLVSATSVSPTRALQSSLNPDAVI